MTISLEMQCEELRAELSSACDSAERRQIAAELATIEAEKYSRLSAEPPF